jgi:V/A-type H+-transporting ATPase subunit F
MKVFFIGDPLLISGYQISGLQVIAVSSGTELIKSIEETLKIADVGIILVDHDFSSQVKDKIEQMKMKYSLPILVEVPGRRTSAKIDLRSTISKIMGVKI